MSRQFRSEASMTLVTAEPQDERVAAEMADWIRQHGSTRLQLAFQRGYPCMRTYVEERAAHDIPGWEVANGDEGDYEEASDPSARALALETEAINAAQAAGLPTGRVRIMRLRTAYWSPDEGEITLHREVVVVEGYLNAHRLVRAV
jgi:hypothetical protein